MKKFLTLLAMAASLLAVSCNKNNEEEEEEQKKEETKGLGIKIDGNFDDWAALKSDVVVSAKNDPNSPWDAVSEIRCCSDKDFVYYYMKFNKEAVNDLMDIQDEMPIRLCLDTNNDFTTGYENYFLDPYDFIIEGALADGGAWTTYDGTLHQRNSEGKWDELLPPNNNLVTGKGNGGEYEILLARELFNNAVPAGHKIGDVFYTGIRFYGYDWGELSNMPNSSIEVDERGWGHLLKITTVK
ncbi:MAG: hypothetical protein IJP49_08825 [Bacteroidales bacterium]|jgi:hypothetical protein|nr:hypothetical protein [Bacteroidales bacterium]